MSRTLTAADRRALIRLASTLPAGSEERKAILAGLSHPEGSVPLSRSVVADSVRYEWGRTSDGYHSSAFVGVRMIGTIGLDWFDRDDLKPSCREDFEKVLNEMEYQSGWSVRDHQIQKWRVHDVGLDSEYRGKGIGYKMYENIFQITRGQKGVIIIPDGCFHGGVTSWSARSVYERLGRNYVSKGDIVGSYPA